MFSATDSSRLTMLLPSEQEGWHRSVCGLLEPQGVSTVVARTGNEALNMMKSMAIHVAVLDTQMPQLGGLQVIKLMRGMNLALPAILLTNELTSHLLQEALGMHVFCVLCKPVELNLLLDALARVLKRYHENRWPDGMK